MRHLGWGHRALAVLGEILRHRAPLHAVRFGNRDSGAVDIYLSGVPRQSDRDSRPDFVFIGVLVLGLVYEIKKGALDWEK